MRFYELTNDWRNDFTTGMGVLYRTPRERLSFATVIIDAIVVDSSTDPVPLVRTVVANFKRDWRKSFATSGYVKRGTRYHGNVEIDLLRPDLLGGENKRRLLTELGIDIGHLKEDERILLVHYHAVVDAKGHQEGYRKAVAAAFPGHRRVLIRSIYETRTVAENLADLAGYMTKMRFRYSQAYEGTKTKFCDDYEPDWHQWFREFISDLLPNLTISSLVSRASVGKKLASPECPISQTGGATIAKETAALSAISPTTSVRAVPIETEDMNEDNNNNHKTLIPNDFTKGLKPTAATASEKIRPEPNDILARIMARTNEPKPRPANRPSPDDVLDRIRNRIEGATWKNL